MKSFLARFPRVLLVLSCCLAVPAQAFWFENASFVNDPFPAGGSSVRLGDVTGDGRIDVVVAMDVGTPGIYVYPGQANGQLGAPQRIHSLGSHSVLLLDIDRDGVLDIVGEQAGIVLYRSDRHGGFVEHGVGDVIVGASSRLVSNLIAYDVTGDGRPEIIGLHWYGSAQVFYLGADGRVASTRSFTVPTQGYNDMAVGDVDHDGKPDLVLTSAQGAYATHLQVLGPDGSGGLQVRAEYSGGFNGLGGLAVGDFNDDGLEEVVVSRSFNLPEGELWVIQLDEAMEILSLQPLPIENGVPSALETADLNGDGRDDLALFHNGGWGWGYYLQRAEGGLYPEAMVTVGRYITGWMSEMLATGDIDGDGCADMVVSEVNYALTMVRGSNCGQKLPAADLELHARSYTGVNTNVEWPYGNSNVLEIKYRVRRADLRVADARIRVTLNLRPGYHSSAIAYYNNMYTDRQLCAKVAEKPSTLIYDCAPYPSSGLEFFAPDLWQVMAFYFDLHREMVADVEIHAVSAGSPDPHPADNVVRLRHTYVTASAPGPVNSPQAMTQDAWRSGYGTAPALQVSRSDVRPARLARTATPAPARWTPVSDGFTPAARRALIDRRGQPARKTAAGAIRVVNPGRQLLRTDR